MRKSVPYRPERYKALSGQLGHAYNRLVKKDPVTGEQSLRMHMSLHPFYVQKRTYAGRKYAFRPEKQRLLDAVWPVLVSFSDAGTHTVGMSVSRLAREISPKDSKGKVIPELEVTVSPPFPFAGRTGTFWCAGCFRGNPVGP